MSVVAEQHPHRAKGCSAPFAACWVKPQQAVSKLVFFKRCTSFFFFFFSLILFAVRSHGTVPELMLATVMLHRTWGDSALDHPKRGRNLVDPFLWLFDLKEVRGKRQGER